MQIVLVTAVSEAFRWARWRTSTGLVSLFCLLFFFSGTTSLIYQVAWVRSLSLFFGSDVYSATITLAVFMGGLALGSWLASHFVDTWTRPIAIYGLFEIAIGLAALAVAPMLDWFHDSYRLIYNQHFESAPWLYNGFRMVVAASSLIVPTTLMGATLPLLIRYFVRQADQLGQRAGTFYAMNTLGAFCGTIVGGFVLLPMFGVSRTVALAASLNFAIGVVALFIGVKRTSALGLSGNAIAASPGPAVHKISEIERRAVLAAIALSGLAALALEVVWVRVLVQSFSATVYAFAIMLACFLFGIYYGSFKASRYADRSPLPAKTLSGLLIGLAVASTFLAVCTYLVPYLFGMLVWSLTAILKDAFGTASVVAQFIVASLVILGPTIMLGATFPFAVKAVTSDLERRGSDTGKVYAVNTAGGIVGSLLAGFVFLPFLGARLSLVLIGGLFAFAGLLLLHALRSRAMPTTLRIPFVVAGLGAMAIFSAISVALPSQTVANYGLQRSTQPQVLHHREGVAHTVSVVRNDSGTIIMMVNGNVEADTSLVQRRHFVLKAHLPLLLHPNPEQIGVVGLGLGITLRSTTRYPTVRRVRLIELTSDMVEAHQHLKEITDDVMRNPKIHLRIDDGRNFMAMSDEQFDLITADPIHPRITGVGFLYTREYYEVIKARLRPGGIVTQWMPMYSISPRSFDTAFRTFAQAFPNASFWYVRGHGLFVATIEPMSVDCQNLAAEFANPLVREDLSSIQINSPAQFLGHLLMDSDHIRSYLARSANDEVNTDDNAYLEYRTPFEFLGRTDAIIPDLIRHAGWSPERIMRNCSAEQAAAASDEFQKRLGRIPVELTEPLR
ncbi:fused MFS/spermidine synthase [Bradyrhizobium yuanmingense]|uniref:fused MFS/spermidine synthase n=1 Tax=Bradyrhizobium yuanmingense TaxID=108015 RepID=UPI0023B92A20|nr:fused MFS/spermidine synthase [Bradyrhizobium yuanmingense]MDF0517587.1 fused MFS/spermidine synthase [Bradyrhizobium yuanmingense]